MKTVSSLPLTALLALCATFLVACGQAPGGPPPTFTGPAKVSAVLMQSAPLSLTAELPGRVTAMALAQVRPQVTGIIQERLFDEGSMVEAGQVLYQIDPATHIAAVDSAKAALARAEASRALAELKAKRNRELVDIKAVSRQTTDESDAALKQAQAEVDSARAALQTQLINLQYTQIKSPIGGRVGRSAVTMGALVTANQANSLASVQQLDPIYIDVTQPSLALLELKQSVAKGALMQGAAAVDILLQNNSQYSEKGLLQFSEVTVDQSTDTVTLRIRVPNPNGDLLPGMYARALLEVGVVEQALLVPQKAVMRDASGQAQVAVVREADEGAVEGNGIMEVRSIKVSRAIGDQWLVDEGLVAGDRVIVEGQQKVRPGGAVEVVSLGMSAVTTPVVQL